MATYTAFFRTAAAYAMHDFEADFPEQALEMARAFFDTHDDDLMFEAYDGSLPLDEIEIAGPEGHALVVWHSDDMRPRPSAPALRIEGDMNTRRAAWASAALAAFCALTGQNTEEEAEEAMSDLLCDLLHLAKAKGFNPQTMLTRAVGHYEHEVLYPDA